jgi:cytochrome c oxidase cbb3-type subunit I/II
MAENTPTHPILPEPQLPSGFKADRRAGDQAARLWFLISILWFPFFATFGFILAIKFFLPEFIGNTSWFTFGVVRPAHTNGVLFGFVSSGLLGSMFYIVPRLCAAPLFRPQLVTLAAVLWNGLSWGAA